LVEGRIQTRSWKDESGSQRWMTEIVAREVVFLSGPTQSGDSAEGEKVEVLEASA